ncbi:GspH/FimT family pseudopilin [Pseudomonas sp. MIL19]|uniref:GspH/FimT family pseudopilin n=1 Tax=Pseudomonas sp. MIL19 TaxID=2976979 RepID=UPI002363B390|nr:GspH/FimT family pseudopilin [Pseudomonas sp. MIL19]MDD2162199.1 GspH/FimT family pseudopilin [Pseudomonas sp. MIL19]
MVSAPAYPPRCLVSRRLARGFTLVELMIVLAVLAVLLGIAAPSMSQFTFSGKLRSYSNEVVASAVLARSEAIKRNQVVTLCVSSNGTSCAAGSWESGWIVRSSGGEVVHRQKTITDGFKIIGSVSSIAFQPSGVGSTVATLKVCRATPSLGNQESEIAISATGRTAVKRQSSSSCL